MEDWKRQFKSEFGIHFSESELQFALEFIEQVAASAKEAGRREKGSSWREGYQRGLEEGRVQAITEVEEKLPRSNDTGHQCECGNPIFCSQGNDYRAGVLAAISFLKR